MASGRVELCHRCRLLVKAGVATTAMGLRWVWRSLLERAVAIAGRLRRRQAVYSLSAGGASGDVAAGGWPAADAWLSGATVLVVGAGSDEGASLVSELEEAGFSAYSAVTVGEAVQAIATRSVSLLVVAGPGVTGSCVALREATSLPILALLPNMTEEGVLSAFAAGADDCQSAIIGGKEVVLRVRAMLRRTRQVG